MGRKRNCQGGIQSQDWEIAEKEESNVQEAFICKKLSCALNKFEKLKIKEWSHQHERLPSLHEQWTHSDKEKEQPTEIWKSWYGEEVEVELVAAMENTLCSTVELSDRLIMPIDQDHRIERYTR